MNACPGQCRASSKFFKPSPETESCTHVVGSLGDDTSNADVGQKLCLEDGPHAYLIVLAVSGTSAQRMHSKSLETHDLGMSETRPVSGGKVTLSITLWRAGNARIA
ncbi:hypothetical protein N7G274_004720 [Stereocaulon virgatum]|uniref:Uncharacterized protein n=1 Tax=Stereocaulon virgatum TaxID=373712 RepID=A0ABR4A8M3_9LECA